MEQKVIIDIRNGNRNTMEEVYVKHFPMIRDYILKNSGSATDAKDIYQEAMLVFVEKCKQNDFELTAKIGSFLYSISRNLWLKQLRNQTKNSSNALLEVVDDNESEVEAHIERQGQLEMILKGIKSLGDSCQKIIEMFFFEKASMKEISLEMGYTNEANAKNQKYKCMQKLKRNIAQIG